MHVTSSGVFNNKSDFPLNNRKKEKKSRVIASNIMSASSEWNWTRVNVNVFESVHSNGKFYCIG